MYSEAQNCLQEPLGEIHATSCGIRNTLHIPRDMYEHNTCQRGRGALPPSSGSRLEKWVKIGNFLVRARARPRGGRGVDAYGLYEEWPP